MQLPKRLARSSIPLKVSVDARDGHRGNVYERFEAIDCRRHACCAGRMRRHGVGGTSGPAVEAPSLKVGDRWSYRGKDGYRVPILWEETREITAIGPQGIIVRVIGKGTTGDYQRTETWSAPGVVTIGAVYDYETDRFDPALVRYKYPMTTGDVWSQNIRDLNKPPYPFG